MVRRGSTVRVRQRALAAAVSSLQGAVERDGERRIAPDRERARVSGTRRIAPASERRAGSRYRPESDLLADRDRLAARTGAVDGTAVGDLAAPLHNHRQRGGL